MTQPSPPELSGVRLKLARAQVHIDAIRATVQEFVEQDPPPFGFRSEQRPMGVRAVEYTQYAIVREQPPRALAPMIGDAVHNIRSALDHLAYELAPARARKSGKTQFPIFTDEAGYRERGEPRIKGIIGDERTLIERVQPWYAMPERPKQDPLAVLNRLSNLDKHRLLVPVIAEVAYNQVYVGSDGADVEITYVHPGAVTHGDKVVAFTASCPALRGCERG